MTLPTITEECVLAQLSKATQKPMDEFAADVMMELTSEQPVTMACIVALLEPVYETAARNSRCFS